MPAASQVVSSAIQLLGVERLVFAEDESVGRAGALPLKVREQPGT